MESIDRRTRRLTQATVFIGLVFAALSLTRCTCAGESNLVSEHFGNYLGARLPSSIPEQFCPDLFSASTGIVGSHLHSSVYFSRDGAEVYFTLPFGASGSQSIVVMKRLDDTWSAPVLAPFSSDYSDQFGWFSPDAMRLYFGSVRPIPGDSVRSSDFRWWMVERLADNWGQPQFLSCPSSLKRNDGPLYIYAVSADQAQSINIFRTEYNGEHYAIPVDIGTPPNSLLEDYPVLVAPDESYLVIYRSDPSNRRNSGLFISFLVDTGWSDPKHMGDQIGSGFDASLSPDGRYLFYLKRNDGIYWVDVDIVDYLRSHDLELVDKLVRASKMNVDLLPALLDSLKAEHSRYYRFDEQCLQSVVSRLISDGSLKTAAAVEQLNAHLYPNARTASGALFTYSVLRFQDSLETLCQELVAARSGSCNERELNHLGYTLMRAGFAPEAVRVFRLNVDLFSDSYNTYDSYAEGLAHLGLIQEAAVNYEVSLELNPDNSNAREMLRKLAEIEEEH